MPKPANTLSCDVSAVKPSIEMDLRFHTGYVASVPLRGLAGDAHGIRTLVRVTPTANPNREAVFSGAILAPAIAANSKGNLDLSGEFAVGLGRYAVDWLLEDGHGSCSAHWQINAKPDRHLAHVELAITPNTATEVPTDPFLEAGQIARSSRPLYTKVLVNFAPPDASETVLSRESIRQITSILNAIAREPRFGRFSVVAFSVEQQRVLYRQKPSSRIDFPALGRFVKSSRSGTVDIRQLEDPESSAKFLAGLLTRELGDDEPAPDAIVIVSPKVFFDRSEPLEALADGSAYRARSSCSTTSRTR